MADKELSYFPAGHFGAESQRGKQIQQNPRSIIPPLAGWGQTAQVEAKDRILSALMGLGASQQGAMQGAQTGDPLAAAMAAIAGGAGAVAQNNPQAIAQARLEAMPLPDESALIQKHPEFKGMTLGMIQKLAPYIQRNEAMEQRQKEFEQRMALLQAQMEGKAGRENAKESAKATAKTKAQDDTFVLYETARDGMLSGLSGSVTGPISGRIPAVTAKQQIAEGSVAAMAPVLKQLFRVSGEGVFTDRDQQLLLDMIPTRKTHPEAAASLIQNIDAIVKAKLGMAGGSSPAQAQSTASAGGEVRRKVRTNQGDRIGVWSAAGKFLRYE